MAKKTVKDLGNLAGTHVFVRVDYNVPLEGGRITDDTRIRASLPTLEHLIRAGARLALASHLGRPKKGPTPELSLRPVAARLGELLGRALPMASDKIEVIQALLARVDSLLIGGGMAYTFFRARGDATGKSLVEEDKVPLAADLLKKGASKIVLPADHVVASRFAADADSRTLPAQEVPEGWLGLDIGPETPRTHAARLRARRVLARERPLGLFET